MKTPIFVLVLGLLAVRCSSKPTNPDEMVMTDEKLSDAQHFDGDGHHDHRYDQEAFLGKDMAEEFAKLTPEESRRRLGIIVGKMDKNKSGFVDKEELMEWIRHSTKRGIYEDTEKRWEYYDRDKSGDVHFDEWVKSSYSYMAEPDRIDDLYDKTRKVTYRQQIESDRRKFALADENGDGKFDREEMAVYLHPSDFPKMRDFVVTEYFNQMDENKDGRVSREEYLADLYNPERDGPEEPEWFVREKEHFASNRDINQDGYLDKEELGHWLVPTHYDPVEAEAAHLIHEADTDGDQLLTKDEILHSQDVFVGSLATEFGKALKRHDEF